MERAQTPETLLGAGAGVDLTKPDALETAMKTFEETLNEVGKLMVE